MKKNLSVLLFCTISAGIINAQTTVNQGKAIAEIFAVNGYNLFLSSRGEVNLYKTMEELVTKYPTINIKAKAFDLSIKEQAKAKTEGEVEGKSDVQ